MNAQHAEHPSGGRTHGADLHHRAIERARMQFEATPSRGLQRAQEPGALKIQPALVGQAPRALGQRGAVAKGWNELAHTLEVFVAVHFELPRVLNRLAWRAAGGAFLTAASHAPPAAPSFAHRTGQLQLAAASIPRSPA